MQSMKVIPSDTMNYLKRLMTMDKDNKVEVVDIPLVSIQEWLRILRIGADPEVPYSHDNLKFTRDAIEVSRRACRAVIDSLRFYITHIDKGEGDGGEITSEN